MCQWQIAALRFRVAQLAILTDHTMYFTEPLPVFMLFTSVTRNSEELQSCVMKSESKLLTVLSPRENV